MTGNPYYLVTLRYDSEEFGGLGRDLFLRVLAGEGIPSVPTYLLQPHSSVPHLYPHRSVRDGRLRRITIP